eukprot:CAMPEP_0170491256 /NCGR_PEP_ID=MMETSP0208-20121228/10680_1 /TAXON_ID=197538 /ORGANISM="Strombidium inclinatum, Strain S3" /LENGTH=106 /DNA_ID=CAMNT_0010766803 /DNA_START=51 /DNA_END=371 /DNA_ORIENTATION=-
MSETNNKSGLFVGLNKGHIVKTVSNPKKNVHNKGKISKRCAAVREVINEIAGLSPMEKRMSELIKTGIPAKEKRALKFARAKLGTHKRAMARREAVNNMIISAKRK